MWAEPKASTSEARAGSEEAGLLWRGVRLRVGRVRGTFAFATVRVCPGWGRLCTAIKSGPGPGGGQSTGVGVEGAWRGAGVRSGDTWGLGWVGVARPGVEEGRPGDGLE